MTIFLFYNPDLERPIHDVTTYIKAPVVDQYIEIMVEYRIRYLVRLC